MARNTFTSVRIEKDNTDKILNQLDANIMNFLAEVGGEIASEAARNSRVDTGQLKSSWTYILDSNEKVVHIGSPLENAIWEEFGTGEYAVNGNGRKGGWVYPDRKGDFHFTRGKTPNHTLERAYNSKKRIITKRAKSVLKRGIE